MGFFKFYVEKFDPEKHFINLSPWGGPFVKKAQMKELFCNDFLSIEKP